MLLRITGAILTLSLFAYLLSIYFSGINSSERNFNAMLISGKSDLKIIENYLKHHNQVTSSDYDKALQLVAQLDEKYLEQVIHYYSTGSLILNTSTADLILQKLPSESSNINFAAGRIYATKEFNQYKPKKAVIHLEYAALRGNKNAAAPLSKIYSRSNCYIEAITWAKQANKRGSSSECTQLPINVNLLSEKQWSAVLYNEDELESANKANRLPILHYSDTCIISK